MILGKVHGNIQFTDRLDIRSEGSLTGDVITQRISVEDGAILKGSVQVRAVEHKNATQAQKQAIGEQAAVAEQPELLPPLQAPSLRRQSILKEHQQGSRSKRALFTFLFLFSSGFKSSAAEFMQ